MADDKTKLPEGTDRIIEGLSEPSLSNSGALGIGQNAGARDPGNDDDTLIITDTTLVVEEKIPAPQGDVELTREDRGNSASAMMNKVRSGGERLSGQAADKARGLVGQGLERSAEALANVSRLVGDTADGLDERLGADFGDYARRAASAIEGAANSLASKDADELINDTRNFVRKSPGVALAGAAIVGFALARLIKSGLAGADDEGNGRSGRSES